MAATPLRHAVAGSLVDAIAGLRRGAAKTPKITEVLLLHLHRLSRPGDHARQDADCDIHCRLVDAGDRREKSLVGLDNHRPREVLMP
jgi:hypothetical protein